MSLQVSYKKQVLLGIIFIIMIIGIVEGLARIYEYFNPTCMFVKSDTMKNINNELKRQMCHDFEELQWIEDPALRPVPNTSTSTININSEGFRGEEITRKKPENTYRIFIVGGSTTFGTGNTDATTISSYLQNLVDKNNFGKKIQVINAGIPAAFSFTEIHLIKNKLIDYEPDLIIVFDGWNDITTPYEYHDDFVRPKPFHTQLVIDIQKYASFYKTPRIIKDTLDNLQYEINPNKIYHFDETYVTEKANLWEERWYDTCQFLNDTGVAALITLQPMSGSSERTLTEYEKKYFTLWDNERILSNYYLYTEKLNSLSKVCKVADLSAAFDGIHEPIFQDAIHTGPLGNEIIAKKMFEVAKPLIAAKTENENVRN
jgi:hypothetical protein